jgi:hypothetical protein
LDRFDVFTAVIVKKVVFWEIKTHVILHSEHSKCPLQFPAG